MGVDEVFKRSFAKNTSTRQKFVKISRLQWIWAFFFLLSPDFFTFVPVPAV